MREDPPCAHLPWLADEPDAGIDAVRGAAMGGDLLGFSRRARLVLRLPRARLDEALELAGRTLRLQEQGLGALRLQGCGFVVPCKSIAAV